MGVTNRDASSVAGVSVGPSRVGSAGGPVPLSALGPVPLSALGRRARGLPWSLGRMTGLGVRVFHIF
jgi:hypothetical protein